MNKAEFTPLEFIERSPSEMKERVEAFWMNLHQLRVVAITTEEQNPTDPALD